MALDIMLEDIMSVDDIMLDMSEDMSVAEDIIDIVTVDLSVAAELEEAAAARAVRAEIMIVYFILISVDKEL